MLGREIGNWIVERQLNRGGMGEVFAAKHRTLETPAAIKVLRPEHSNVDEFRRRFEVEAQTQAKLSHPGIARVMDYMEKDGSWYLVMEFLPAGSLRDELARVGGPLPADDVLDWSQEALDGLAHVHAKGIVHRDLKPDNIMLNEHRRAVVTDFGIARVQQGPQMTATGMTVGTPAYMSPEQLTRPDQIDAGTDVFAMGVVIFELLTAQLPFGSGPDSVYRQMEGRATPLRSLRPDLSPEVEKVLARALHRDRRQRFANAGEFLRALQMARAPQNESSAPPSPPGMTASMPLGMGTGMGAAAPTMASGMNAVPLGDPRSGTVRWQAVPNELDRPASPQARPRRRGWLLPALAALLFAGAGLLLMNPFQKAAEKKKADAAAGEAALVAASQGSAPLPGQPPAGTTPAQLAQLKAAQGSQIPPGMTAAQAAQLKAAQAGGQLPPGMTPEQAAQLKAAQGGGQIPSGMSPEQLAQLQAAQAGGQMSPGMTQAQLQQLQSAQAGGQVPASMSPAQLAQLQAAQAGGQMPAGMSPAQLEQLKAAQAAGLAPAQMQQLQAQQAAAGGRGIPPGLLPPLPAKPVIAVIAGGEPLMAASLEDQIEKRLRRAGYDVRDELNSIELADKVAAGQKLSSKDAQILARDGFHIVVMVNVAEGKRQKFEFRDLKTAAMAGQLRMNAKLLLNGQPVGRGWTELVEYTELSAQAKAERSMIGPTAELMDEIRETWAKLPKG